MKFSEIPYSRPEKEEMLEALEAAAARFDAAGSAAEQMQVIRDMDTLCSHYDTMSSICYVRNTIDTRDAFYKAEREFWDQVGPLLSEKMQGFNKKLIASPFRAELEKELGSLYFTNIELSLKGFSPEIVPLLQEENALAAKYQELYASAKVEFDGKICNIAQLGPYKQSPDRSVRRAALEAEAGFFDAHRAELDEIFDQMVKNRTAQAKALGFESFVEQAYIRRMRNCYDAAAVAGFRRQVVESLVPITVEIKKRQAARIGIADFKFHDNSFSFPDGNPTPKGTPDELLAAARKMYNEMSPETAAFIEAMFEGELFDLVAKDGKAPGGYCTTFPEYKCPFIFSNFNGTSGDVDVLTHEAGHAFAAYVAARKIEFSDLQSPSMEGCETHSMSMEFLTSPWHSLFFKEDTDKYELSHAEEALTFIPYGCMVDHFQEIVYSNPDMTPEERNEAWAKLEKTYRPYIDFDDAPFYGRGAGWQRQTHIYCSPFYYIDYCLAQTTALQFWTAFMADPAAAWKKYLAFVEMGGTKTFVDLVKGAGMTSPLEDGCVAAIAARIREWLDAHQLG
ncbi:MAG: M3 family oligoendopeptidase [Oscillospiraceae bacterium]|jgi:M3 family oligoendopeptidase|nr:M3 family oligoendopeptidase [Oscillospiraceae bacterium]